MCALLVESPYGVTVGINRATYPVPTSAYMPQGTIDEAVTLGLGNYRCQIDASLIWPSLPGQPTTPEPNTANWLWDPLDDMISKIQSRGFTITYPIRGMPAWGLMNPTYKATTESGASSNSPNGDGFYMPDPTVFWTYLQAVLNRYNGVYNIPNYGPLKIHKFEYGNEEFNIHNTQPYPTPSSTEWFGIRNSPYSVYNGINGVLSSMNPKPQPARDPWFMQQVINYCGPRISTTNYPNARMGMGAIWMQWDDNFTDFITGLGSALQYIEWMNCHLYSNADDPISPSLTGGGPHKPGITTALTNMYNAAKAAGYGNIPIEITEFGWQAFATEGTTSTQVTTPGTVTVTPTSSSFLTGVTTNTVIYCESGTSKQELVTPTAVTGTTFTANFVNAHTGTWTLGINGDCSSAVQASRYQAFLSAAKAFPQCRRVYLYTLDERLNQTATSNLIFWNGSTYVQRPAYTTVKNFIAANPTWHTPTDSPYVVTLPADNSTHTVTLNGTKYVTPSTYPATALAQSTVSDIISLGSSSVPIMLRWKLPWNVIQPFAPNMPDKSTVPTSPKPAPGGTYDGTYDWSPMDNALTLINQSANAGKIKMCWCLNTAPPWLLTVDSQGNSGATPPVNLDGTQNLNGKGVLPSATDFQTFATAAAKRYGNQIAMYQFGDEEWDSRNRTGTPLGAIAAAVYPAIRNNANSAIIGAGAVRLTPTNASNHISTWLDNFFTAGGVTDFIDLHYYRGGTTAGPDPTTSDANTPSIAQALTLIQNKIQAHSSIANVCVLETGWDTPTSATNGVTTDQQSAYLVDGQSHSTNPPTTITTAGMMSSMRDIIGNGGRIGIYTLDAPSDTKNIASGGTYNQAFTDAQTFISNNQQWATVSVANISVTPTTINLVGTSGGTNPTGQATITNTGTISGTWSWSADHTWLTVTTATGTLAAGKSLTTSFTAAMSGLSPGTYTSVLTYTLGAATATLTVTLTVNSSGTGSFTVSPTSLTFTDTVGGTGPLSKTVTLSNTGASATFNTGTITYGSGGSGWLSSTPTTGTLGSVAQPITVTATTGALAVGTYTATLPFTLGTQTANVVVTFTVNSASNAPGISEDQSALTFNGTTTVAPATQTMNITNTGASNGSWSASSDATWLSVTPVSGNFAAGASQQITVTANSVGLAAGTYAGHITYVDGTASVICTVTLNVTTAALPGLSIDQTSMSFTGVANTNNPATQTLTLTNTSTTAETWTSTSDNPAWLSISPASGNFAAASATQLITMTINNLHAKLIPGTYTGHITFTSTNAAGTATAQTTVTLTVSPKPPPPNLGANTDSYYIANKRFIVQQTGG